MTIDAVGSFGLVNSPIVHTQTTAGGETAVAISDANQVVVYSGTGVGDTRGVFVDLIDEDGAEVLADELVNSTVRGEQHSATVASNSDGDFVVVWAGRGDGDKNGIFFQRYSANGETVGGETLANTTIAGKQIDPTVDMLDDGSFVIGWSGQSTDDPTGVYLQRFDVDGEKVGDQILVNTTTDNHQAGLSLVYTSQDTLVAAWSSLGQDTSDWGVYGQRFDSDGSRMGDEFAWNATTADCQMGVTLAAGPDGEVVAAWQTRGQDGDDWGVAARSLGPDGTTFGDEVVLNDMTTGQQLDAKLAVAEDGQWIATWTTGQPDGAGWEVVARTFDSDGTPQGESFIVHPDNAGANSGHQQHASVATTGESAVVVWSGKSSQDRRGVSRQQFDVSLADTGPQESPDLAPIADATATVGEQVEITVTATDPNSRDTLTFLLDQDNSPTSATIEQTDNNTAIVRWTPDVADDNQEVSFRVLVVDDGDPALSDSEDFTATVGNLPLTIDLNGTEVDGTDVSATFAPGGGAVALTNASLAITGADGDMLRAVGVGMGAPPDGDAESLAVDVLDTNITASYNSSNGTLSLSGADTAENYERVLRTLTYNNTASNPTGSRTIQIAGADEAGAGSISTINLEIGGLDAPQLAAAIADSGAMFFGAGWCPACTEQKELFGDGAQLLPFVEVTNPDRTLNQIGEDNDVEALPTWVFADGTRLEGMQPLQVLAAAAGVEQQVSETPFLAEIPDDTLLVGSPLHIPLDGFDPSGEPLSYTVTTDNPDVAAELLSGNRSMRVDVAGYGDLVFELFEGRASRATERVIDLALEGFYDGLTFHRVVDDFAIQGGDPNGDGSGGSDRPDFDDQFHVDLQHNRAGLLSFAKSSDDTNNSQFFITGGESASLRNLDFNHTIFGILVEGESNREAISNTAVERQQPANPLSEISRPTIDVVMDDVTIFTDNENATVLLRAAEGASGPVEVTVTVTNQAGNSFERKFTVNVQDDLDTIASRTNGRPFLGDISPPAMVTAGTVVEIQLTSTDVEDDPVDYVAINRTPGLSTGDLMLSVSDTGLVSFTPPVDFTGTLNIEVRAQRETPSPPETDFDAQLISIEVVAP